MSKPPPIPPHRTDPQPGSAEQRRTSRRRFLEAGLAAATLPIGAGVFAARPAAAAQPTADATGSRPNLLILMTDQERTEVVLPSGFSLPARDRVASDGVTFGLHHTPTAPCSPARSTVFTGLHAPVNGVLDNVGAAQPDLSATIPTLGTMVKAAGYHTCYIGKWHLTQNITTDPAYLTPYGFDEAIDLLAGGTPNEGTQQDPGVAQQAEAWLAAHAADSQPWLCVVSFVNPHDMMFCPRFYRLDDVPDYGAAVPTNFESDLSSKPPVQTVWRGENEAVGGAMPNAVAAPDDAHQWRQWGNWYLELLRRTDVLMSGVLDALDASGRAADTVVVRLADHGEMGGGHGLRQKGAMIYQENLRVPLVIADPRRPATHGSTSTALTSHIDVVPTLASLAGIDATAFGPLVGHDLTVLLDQPGGSVRTSLLVTSDATSSGLGLPGLRYCIRGVLTARYSFGRYTTPDGIDSPPSGYTFECYDRLADPGELHNLANDPSRASLLKDLNDLVNQLIADELQVGGTAHA
ncbi:sulfatase-like hydrolase/transferase [Frankia sp. Cas3]|uniref:sulfatase-like hydrolase/transferase n=1 Tax=Frankia sp. Cas3 TaxID=3073926 RepID=UPI002AD5AF9E|nr:sulfatase-like hydrolase/transferase [Frankia sp. Cas3]